MNFEDHSVLQIRAISKNNLFVFGGGTYHIFQQDFQ